MKTIEDILDELEKEMLSSYHEITAVYLSEKDGKKVIKVGVEKFDPKFTKIIPRYKNGYEIIIEETGKYVPY